MKKAVNMILIASLCGIPMGAVPNVIAEGLEKNENYSNVVSEMPSETDLNSFAVDNMEKSESSEILQEKSGENTEKDISEISIVGENEVTTVEQSEIQFTPRAMTQGSWESNWWITQFLQGTASLGSVGRVDFPTTYRNYLSHNQINWEGTLGGNKDDELVGTVSFPRQYVYTDNAAFNRGNTAAIGVTGFDMPYKNNLTVIPQNYDTSYYEITITPNTPYIGKNVLQNQSGYEGVLTDFDLWTIKVKRLQNADSEQNVLIPFELQVQWDANIYVQPTISQTANPFWLDMSRSDIQNDSFEADAFIPQPDYQIKADNFQLELGTEINNDEILEQAQAEVTDLNSVDNLAQPIIIDSQINPYMTGTYDVTLGVDNDATGQIRKTIQVEVIEKLVNDPKPITPEVDPAFPQIPDLNTNMPEINTLQWDILAHNFEIELGTLLTKEATLKLSEAILNTKEQYTEQTNDIDIKEVKDSKGEIKKLKEIGYVPGVYDIELSSEVGGQLVSKNIQVTVIPSSQEKSSQSENGNKIQNTSNSSNPSQELPTTGDRDFNLIYIVSGVLLLLLGTTVGLKKRY
jgi:LPXTG-motif cell wall-anchored protein